MLSFISSIPLLLAITGGIAIPQSDGQSSSTSSTGTGSSSTGTGTAASASSSGNSSSGGDYTGKMTFYNPSAGLSACGGTYQDNDTVAALAESMWENGAHCNQGISLTINGITHDTKIVERCPGCPYGGLDLSPALWDSFGVSQDLGHVEGEWKFTDGGGSSASGSASAGSSDSATGSPSGSVSGSSSTSASSSPGASGTGSTTSTGTSAGSSTTAQTTAP